MSMMRWLRRLVGRKGRIMGTLTWFHLEEEETRAEIRTTKETPMRNPSMTARVGRGEGVDNYHISDALEWKGSSWEQMRLRRRN